jgi:hypothetical protein
LPIDPTTYMSIPTGESLEEREGGGRGDMGGHEGAAKGRESGRMRVEGWRVEGWEGRFRRGTR